MRSPGYPAAEASAEPVWTGKGACAVFVGAGGARRWTDSGYRLQPVGYRPLCHPEPSLGVFFPKAKLRDPQAVLRAVEVGGGRDFSVPDLVRAVWRVAETDEAFAVHVADAAEGAAALAAIREESARLGVEVVEGNAEGL